MADGDVQAESTDTRTDNTGGRPAGTPRARIVAGRPGLLERFPDIFFPAPAVLALLAIMVFPSFFNLYISLNEWFAASASPPFHCSLEYCAEPGWGPEEFGVVSPNGW